MYFIPELARIDSKSAATYWPERKEHHRLNDDECPERLAHSHSEWQGKQQVPTLSTFAHSPFL